ncbi:low affinity immunoglobulin gamma Fc region receptor II-like [Centropristis striata]|uniref:low affinity immunoglobulin gamma Fc region receptor II-like n=1 Tax=Centropristis striata TaxID=184440 RepID=UPI0027E0A370|nr:low affinity immunoglobulin gamma Fc region receptor II-like [Centropristis striata]
MKVSALCIRLMVTVLLKNSLYVQEADAASINVDPNRLQFFEYESISLTCGGIHGSSEWRVMKKISSDASRVETSTGSLKINPAFKSHSGEYFCENGEGERSNAVNISVTAGEVILDIPALPVMEGKMVSLRCRKKTSAISTADFFKDDHFMKTEYTGNMTIPSVSLSSEGLYRCRIPGAGRSPESWLAVRAYIAPRTQQTTPQQSSAPPPSPGSDQLSTMLPVVLTSVCVAVLLLVVAGLLHFRVCRVASFSFGMPTGSKPVSVCEQASVAEQPMDIYANITGRRKKRVREQASVAEQPMDIYANITGRRKKRGC